MILSTLIRLLFITRYVKKSYPCAIKGSKVDHVTDPEGMHVNYNIDRDSKMNSIKKRQSLVTITPRA